MVGKGRVIAGWLLAIWRLSGFLDDESVDGGSSYVSVSIRGSYCELSDASVSFD